MQNRTVATLLTACLAAAIAAPTAAQETDAQQTEVTPAGQQPNAAQLYAAQPRIAEQTIEATAKVTAVDKAARTVTLKNEDGESQSIEPKKIAAIDKPTALAFGPDGSLYITAIGSPAEGATGAKEGLEAGGAGKVFKIGPGL